jgi:hypothetical protein
MGRLVAASSGRAWPASRLRGRERVVEGLDRFSSGRRVENEASSLASVLDLDPEVVLEISAIPEQVDDDSAVLAVSEMTRCG